MKWEGLGREFNGIMPDMVLLLSNVGGLYNNKGRTEQALLAHECRELFHDSRHGLAVIEGRIDIRRLIFENK